MKTLRLLMVNIQQIFSPAFFIFGFCATTFLLISISGMYYIDDGIFYLLDRSLMGTGTALMFFTILPTLPFATSLADDYESGVIKYYKIKSSMYSYTISKVISSAISGFCVIFLSMLMFILILLPVNPYFTSQSSYYAYELMMVDGQVFLGSLFYLTHLSLSGAIIACVSTCITTFIPDKFVAVTLPCVLYLFHGRITATMDIELFFMHTLIIEGIVPYENPYSVLFYKTLLTIITVIISCVISCVKMKGRVNNGEY